MAIKEVIDVCSIAPSVDDIFIEQRLHEYKNRTKYIKHQKNVLQNQLNRLRQQQEALEYRYGSVLLRSQSAPRQTLKSKQSSTSTQTSSISPAVNTQTLPSSSSQIIHPVSSQKEQQSSSVAVSTTQSAATSSASGSLFFFSMNLKFLPWKHLQHL